MGEWTGSAGAASLLGVDLVLQKISVCTGGSFPPCVGWRILVRFAPTLLPPTVDRWNNGLGMINAKMSN